MALFGCPQKPCIHSCQKNKLKQFANNIHLLNASIQRVSIPRSLNLVEGVVNIYLFCGNGYVIKLYCLNAGPMKLLKGYDFLYTGSSQQNSVDM